MKYCYCTDSKGNTPLHIAAREGFCEVVEILIKTDHPTQHPGLVIVLTYTLQWSTVVLQMDGMALKKMAAPLNVYKVQNST